MRDVPWRGVISSVLAPVLPVTGFTVAATAQALWPLAVVLSCHRRAAPDQPASLRAAAPARPLG
ncbi:MAG: hypothetical protein ACRDPY_03485 [Streptosporangiaceae bacterium]